MLFLCCVILALSQVTLTFGARCACVKDGSVLNVRTGPSTSNTIVAQLRNGECHPYRSSSNEWHKISYGGADRWSHGGFMVLKECPGTSGVSTSAAGCPNIISRSGWGARSATGPRLPKKPQYVFIHHGTGPSCSTRAECTRIVKAYQNYHMDTQKWGDIGYSFVVGEDGNVYEARGWDRVGAHTYGYNSKGIAICFVGDFTSRLPNARALEAARKLISCGIAQGHIPSNYILKGHRDVGTTACPGNTLYNHIRSWPHYA